jgi:Tol biopolymer transport system component
LIVLIVLLAMLVGAPVASADLATGPRLASIELIERGGFEDLRNEPDVSLALAIVDPATGREKRLLQRPLEPTKRVVPSPFNPPAWSADGSLVAFNAAKGESDRGRLFVVRADGSGLRAVPRAINAVNPVFSPDGRMLAFARSRIWTHIDRDFFKNPAAGYRAYSSTTTWVVDLAGGKPRRLTPWENGLDNTPTSFSPDGSSLLLTRRDGSRDGPKVMRMSLAYGSTRKLLGRAKEAVYSPDGTRVAFTGFLHPDLVEAEEGGDYLAEELYVANADGSGVKRLSHSEGIVETAPSWDPSGRRLAYVRWRADDSWLSGLASLFPVGNAWVQVNADGSCRQKIASLPTVAFYGAVWQPGLGREAGPLSC